MPFRSIVATPEDLALIVAAFEKAWSEIEARRATDPLRARLKNDVAWIPTGLGL
jgi:hypothetical protein